MTNNIAIAAFATTLPLSLVDANVVSSISRLPSVDLAARPALPVGIRIDRVNALRRQIRNGTYRVSASQLASAMVEATLAF